ncbi:MAG: protease inhibitor I42 family protein [Vulcanimicrobiaceae bacterium]
MKRLFAALSLFLCAAAPATTPNVFTEATPSIAVHVGQTFVIGLLSSPSTGFGWRMSGEITQSKLAFLGSTYLAPNTTRVGAGGTELYLFTARQAGTYTLTFSYSRPWEAGVPAAKTVTFAVAVTPAK